MNKIQQDLELLQVVSSLTPELKALYDIRMQVTDSIKKKIEIPKFTNLYELVSSPNLLRIALKKLSKNFRSTTQNLENETIKLKFVTFINSLSQQLKDRTFKWKSVQKSMTPRQGENIRRFCIINFSEKLLQSNILMILESIYEPIFENLNCSFGFRPYRENLDSIEAIMRYSNQDLIWAIKGDITGSFNTIIHFPTLINKLKKYIDDKEFLQLIYDACTISRINSTDKILTTLDFITCPGNSIFPTLFNIYMHDFDFEVSKSLYNILKLYKKNQRWDVLKYSKLEKKIIFLDKKIQLLENITLIRQHTVEEFKLLYKIRTDKIKLINKTSKKNYLDYFKLSLRHTYNRHANSFIILIDISFQLCKNIKTIIEKILRKNKIVIGLDKIKITKLTTTHTKYIGFTLFMQERNLMIRRNTNCLFRVRRRVICGLDLEKIYERLVYDKFALPKTFVSLAVASWTTLKESQIIERYNSIMLAIYDYYYPVITYKTELRRIYYILYYSCIKTLARKHKTTVSQIFTKYGWEEHNSQMLLIDRKRIVYFAPLVSSRDKIEYKYTILLNHFDLKRYAVRAMRARKRMKQCIKKDKFEYINNLWFCNLVYLETEKLIQLDKDLTYKVGRVYLQQQFEDIWMKYNVDTFEQIVESNVANKHLRNKQEYQFLFKERILINYR